MGFASFDQPFLDKTRVYICLDMSIQNEAKITMDKSKHFIPVLLTQFLFQIETMASTVEYKITAQCSYDSSSQL